MTDQILMYTTSWCPDCTRVKRLFERSGIAFEEIDVDRIDGAEDLMKKANGGSRKVPTVLIGSEVLVEPSNGEVLRALQALSV